MPNNVMALNTRGCLFLSKKMYDKAIADFSEVIHYESNNFAAITYRAQSYWEKKEYINVINDQTTNIRLHPLFAPAYQQRGAAYYEMTNYIKAIDDLKYAITLDPQYADAYNDLAWLIATCPVETNRNGNLAIQFAQKACELTNWEKSYCIGTLAAAYAELGDFNNAVKYQKQALEMIVVTNSERVNAERLLKLYQNRQPNREVTPTM